MVRRDERCGVCRIQIEMEPRRSSERIHRIYPIQEFTQSRTYLGSLNSGDYLMTHGEINSPNFGNDNDKPKHSFCSVHSHDQS